MPGYAWGIPASHCITGSKLAKQEGTPCATCTARKKRFLWPNVRNAYERRYQQWLDNPTTWAYGMIEAINESVTIGVPYFRWFDSGDIQSMQMLNDINFIASETPSVHHWLPTQERQFVTGFKPAKNLVIRVSSPMINGFPPAGFANTSVVMPKQFKRHWADRVARNTKTRWACPAVINKTYECGNCRACWDPEIETILYAER